MTTFYSEEDGCHVYPLRCDKHNFKPYEYCEMCYIKSRLQSIADEARKEFSRNASQMCIAINDLNDFYFKLDKKINALEKLVVK